MPTTDQEKENPDTAKRVTLLAVDKETIQLNLNNIGREVEVWRVSSKNGRVRYDALARLVEAKKKLLSWLTVDLVKNHLKKL